MLFDGAIKFCRQAVDAIGREDWEGMYNALVRAQKIVIELNTSLDHEVDPELCGKLASLYNYIYRRLVDANLERDDSPVHESIGLLEYERETWQMVIRKTESEDGSGGAAAEAAAQPAGNPIGRIAPESDEAEPAPRSPGLSVEG